MGDRRNINRRFKSISDLEFEAYDNYVSALTVITEPHRMIHDGMFFDASQIVASVANGANLDILLKFPAGAIGHLLLVEFTLQDAPCDIFFYEDTTVSADGAAVNVRNHNRVGTPNDSSNAEVFTGPTVTDVGTLLHERFIPDAGGQGNQAAGLLVAGEDAEWVLGHPTEAMNYMWRLTNNSGGAIKASFHFNGYEILDNPN